MTKSQGKTPSEQYLASLCEKTFLSLWSYPNLFNDKGLGKELCDLLVVFGNDIIIFSDKSCTFPTCSDSDLAWQRWYRRAILKSADQVFGAERYIKDNPTKLFLDPQATRTLPLELPPKQNMRFHRVVIALNASEPCKNYFGGGSGSLMIRPLLKDADHYSKDSEHYLPFSVGHVNSAKGFVHVFDDVSLDIVLQELDTIADFVEYLRKKESFVCSGSLIGASGEEDLLAYYLRNIENKEAREFTSAFEQSPQPKILVDQGLWEEIQKHPQFIARNEANEISWFWDNLIEEFSRHYSKKTLVAGNDNPELEQALRRLASETRFQRRYLSELYLERLRTTPPHMRSTRVLQAPNDPTTAYVFAFVPKRGETEDNYRLVRRNILEILCGSAKIKFNELKTVIGIASTTIGSAPSFDLISMDVSFWGEQEYAEAKRELEEFQLMKAENVAWKDGVAHEYPEVTTFQFQHYKESQVQTKLAQQAQKQAKRKKKDEKQKRRQNRKK